ncbi:MAG TPA: response regulator [Candidatus Eisenbergiella merdavium]|uniref:Stage 0 sporulation protein A homolog n=1 Tax=Candidatus Eisenbergiella merdavium TaxID=2838551 RepID=A0A9D2SQC7_9FIRM|nr:response regulator [Candidatus Eisenbergiella merdavium]
MYKIVIADDEVWVGVGIKKMIGRSGLPFEVIAEAPNGIRAYEQVKELGPELLISDIRMPGLNGIELMKKLVEEENPVKVIFISGYAQFEYAQEACRMGAFDYLLKPVEEESLNAILERFCRLRENQAQPVVETEIGAGDPRIRKIISEINLRYTQKLSLGELADRYGLSIGHLSTLIKKETGMSYSEYITGKRMEDAKRLLQKEELSLEEISDMVGYHDYFYFTKVFKKYTGISPSVYRKKR